MLQPTWGCKKRIIFFLRSMPATFIPRPLEPANAHRLPAQATTLHNQDKGTVLSQFFKERI